MKLSVSNIAWTAEQEVTVYKLLQKYGFSGLEIAPTRVFPEMPYDKKNDAALWAKDVRDNYGISVVSMQSIWYGKQERLFGTTKERESLLAYTKKAIDFAAAVNCKNLVFGCPRNRILTEGADPKEGVNFFKSTGDYAAEKGTAIGIEANPPIYNTNYICNTMDALKLIGEVRSPGFLLNLDVGTMIQNKESIDGLRGSINLINHVHISEPGLKPIKKRTLHRQLKDLLDSENYQGFISIEMGKTDNIFQLENILGYVKEIFGS